jgi:hypothetical protein
MQECCRATQHRVQPWGVFLLQPAAWQQGGSASGLLSQHSDNLHSLYCCMQLHWSGQMGCRIRCCPGMPAAMLMRRQQLLTQRSQPLPAAPEAAHAER